TAVAEAQTAEPPKSSPAAGVFAEVKPGKLVVNVQERGNLESTRVASVFNKVMGSSTIISILPEGRRVKAGQLVCELDSAPLKDRLVLQVEQTKKAESAYRITQGEREVAELALKEYEDGIYPQELLAIKGDASLARLATVRAEEQLKRSRDAREQLEDARLGQAGNRPPPTVTTVLDVEDRIAAAEQAIERGRVAQQVEQAKQATLEKYTKEKSLKQLRNRLEKAHAVEADARAAWDAERSKVAGLEKQIGYCQMFAPADGVLVYANDPSRIGTQMQPQIEEGATVRERQIIFTVPDLSQIQVNSKIHESIVDRLKVGLRARIRVDAFSDKEFTGVVKDVAPLPDPSNFFNRDIKVYTCHVSIDEPISGLRPGMTAQVDILVTELDNVLSVPVQAVVSYDRKDHVAVKRPDGGVDWREVTLGMTNDKSVEVKEGVKPGESVSLEPASLLSDEKKRDATFYPVIPAPTPTPRVKGKTALGIPNEIRTKLQALSPEDRQQLREASPEDVHSILSRKAGLTEDEIQRYLRVLRNPSSPR
ncbi:efflux RND transporter periplasmic adaptor subunit, partial [Singulisphaera rosea]